MTVTFRADPRMAARLVLALALGMLGAGAGTAGAAAGKLSKASQQCLDCHGAKGLEKKLGDGATLALHVDGPKFANSAHNLLGCAVCHGDISTDSHPPSRKQIANAREYALEMQQVCSTCHSDQAKEYEGSVHAALLLEVIPVAPICTTCHNPHAVVPKQGYEVATGAPCSTCHTGVFEAYSKSVHGEARKAGRVEAPACTTCHGSHAVKAAVGGEKIKETCQACHSAALSAHQNWLPNAALHLKTISCAACHAPGTRRRVDLKLYDTAAQERITEKQGVPQFEDHARAADAGGKGLDAKEVQAVLRKFDPDGKQGKAVLRGRLEVDSGVDAHLLAHKDQASGKCEGCHSAGSDPFQRVTISIAGADGRPVRYDASHEVLSSVVSVESVGGFYVIGGTRIKLLDILVVLALLGGVSVPLAHLAFGWLSRRYAKRIGGREDS